MNDRPLSLVLVSTPVGQLWTQAEHFATLMQRVMLELCVFSKREDAPPCFTAASLPTAPILRAHTSFVSASH